jgi:uncharacterized repeat protein (TIGR04076 family)
LKDDHWINEAESMLCPDGKVRYIFKLLD